MVGVIGLPSFVATYGMNMLAAGLATIVMNGGIIYDLPPNFTKLGIGFLGSAIFQDYKGGMCTDDLVMLYISGAVLLGIGAAFLLNYIVGKKMLVKEMEAEQRKLLEEA